MSALPDFTGLAFDDATVAAAARPAPDVTPDTQFTGALLRQVRESRRVALREISQRTKISVPYLKAIEEQPEIRELIKDAHSDTDGNVLSTKNWSHLADRLVGENWWICGEAAGFADPILAAGMTLAHGTSREVAYSILEVESREEAENLAADNPFITSIRVYEIRSH